MVYDSSCIVGEPNQQGRAGRPGRALKDKAAEAEAVSTPENVRAILHEFAPIISDSVAGGIATYLRLLLRWNEKISLTSIRSPSEILTRHFGESFFGARVAGIATGRLLDVGSGAGFPGLPIFLAFPETQGELLEPNVKKEAFLAEVCGELGLTDRVHVVRARLEDYSAPPGGYEFVTSRAVRITAKFLEKCWEMLPASGRLVLWLGEEEMAEIERNRTWSWNQPARIPCSERRYVVWGQPTPRASVSRETRE